MAKADVNSKKSKDKKPPAVKEKPHPVKKTTGFRHTDEEKAEIVRWINAMFADGADLKSACDARSITHKTYWVWRNETEALKQHFKDCVKERHGIRHERLRETAYMSLESMMMERKRTRVVREGKMSKKRQDGKMVEVFEPTKVTIYEDTYPANFSAIRMALVALDAEVFGKTDVDNEVVVTFTQNTQLLSPLTDGESDDEG